MSNEQFWQLLQKLGLDDDSSRPLLEALAADCRAATGGTEVDYTRFVSSLYLPAKDPTSLERPEEHKPEPPEMCRLRLECIAVAGRSEAEVLAQGMFLLMDYVDEEAAAEAYRRGQGEDIVLLCVGRATQPPSFWEQLIPDEGLRNQIPDKLFELHYRPNLTNFQVVGPERDGAGAWLERCGKGVDLGEVFTVRKEAVTSDAEALVQFLFTSGLRDTWTSALEERSKARESCSGPVLMHISAPPSPSAIPEDLRPYVPGEPSGFGFQGATQKGLGPEWWGITLEQLGEIQLHPNYEYKYEEGYHHHEVHAMNARRLVEEVVKPQTAGVGLGYALMKNWKRPLRVRHMVSHCWDENYWKFVDALRRSGASGPYWICFVSQYQNEDGYGPSISDQLGPRLETGPFATVLKNVKLQNTKMLAVVTPQADIYTRMWCIYEMYVCIQMEIPVQVAFYYLLNSKFLAVPACEPIDTRMARCGNPFSATVSPDEIKIRALIETLPGGYEKIDHAVEVVRLKGVLARRMKGSPNTRDSQWFRERIEALKDKVWRRLGNAGERPPEWP